MKIAILGAGLAGLACAIECERLGVVPVLFERDESVGMKSPFLNEFTELFSREIQKDNLITYLREDYFLNIKSMGERKKFTMKSPQNQITIQGDMGYCFLRGKGAESIENQLVRMLQKTPIHYNSLSDYKELSSQYDYVVVASGKNTEPVDLGVWQNCGQVSTLNGIAIGKFDVENVTIYFDTEYAGSGFARLSPFSPTQALIELNIIGHEPFEADRLFSLFLRKEKLEHLEFFSFTKLPVFQTGKVTKFKVGNVLLAGRSAGLTERLIGEGAPFALMSGVLAARAIIGNLDYDKLVQPIQEHVENISAHRNIIEKFQNKHYDLLLSLLGTPGIKQLIYNTKINFPDLVGTLIKTAYKNIT